VDPNVRIVVHSTDVPSQILDRNSSKNLLNAIYACPHGVLGMSLDVPGLVETSTNLASVKMGENNTLVVNTSQRSFSESLKNDAANRINAVFSLAGAEVEHGSGYPGWKPNPGSSILHVAIDSYKRLFGVEPQVKAIHAGLECGLFLEKYPHLDMVSCGPTITGAHSPDEQIDIQTVDKWWRFLLDILKNIPEKK
jgi:dipeptidase D